MGGELGLYLNFSIIYYYLYEILRIIMKTFFHISSISVFFIHISYFSNLYGL